VQCCSGICGADPDGVGRCRPAGSCGAAGEVCLTSANCCGGSACTMDPGGAPRCQGF
jgi:hypothetical protein